MRRRNVIATEAETGCDVLSPTSTEDLDKIPAKDYYKYMTPSLRIAS
jgi:hypothetical protein